MLKAMLFDLDGTIADTNTLIFESFRFTLKTHGIDGISDEKIYSFFGEPLFDSMQKFAPGQASELMKTYRSFNERVHDEMIRPFPGVREALAELRDMGLNLGIVTSKRGEVALRSLKVLDLTDYFRVVVTPEHTSSHKPHPAPVRHGVELLGIRPEEAMMIGDSPYDLLSGRAAGTLTCGVDYSRINLNILYQTNPDYMISHVHELVSIVGELNKGVL
jgi:pyrophosphatase PpaX